MLADVKEKAVCLLVSTYLQRDACVDVNKREQATVTVELKKGTGNKKAVCRHFCADYCKAPSVKNV